MAIEFTRRQFFGGLSALLATASARSYAEATGTGKPNLRFGVLSDIHISPMAYMDRFLGGDRKAHRTRETDLLEKAFRYFDEQGADGVLIAGDMADWGLVGQLQAVADCWFRVFPDGRSARDGRKVEQLFALGNHDFEGFRYGYAKKALGPVKLPASEKLVTDMAGNWQRIFREPYSPIWRKEVKGYTFIGAHWDKWTGIAALGDYLKEQGPTLKGPKPFFYAQHPQPKDTCLGSWIWGHDDGRSTQALSAFPNAVAFSGHSHKPLTNELNVWQGAFTSVGTASLYNVGSGEGRENGTHEVRNHRSVMAYHRSRTDDATEAAHGQFVRVYDGFIEIERREFVRGESVGPNWVIPVPAGKEAPFLYANRKAASKAPGPFPAGAKIKVTRTADRVRLEFPPARAITGASPVADYEVEAVHEEADVSRTLFTRYVFGPGIFFDPAKEKGPIVAEFDAKLFPKGGRFFFRARAHEVFGKFNAPISSI